MNDNLNQRKREAIANDFRTAINNLVLQFVNGVNLLKDKYGLVIEDRPCSFSYDLANFERTSLKIASKLIRDNDGNAFEIGINSLDFNRGILRVELRTTKKILTNLMVEPYFYYQNRRWYYKAFLNNEENIEGGQIHDVELDNEKIGLIIEEVFS
jgi:hypothetical protein